MADLSKLDQMPPELPALAKMYASHLHFMGDSAALIIAQSAKETGWWTSKLFREGKGLVGMQYARLEANRKYQTGKPVPLKYGVLHAGYLTYADSLRDRERLLRQLNEQARDAGRTDLVDNIWGLLAWKWAPPDPKYPENAQYVEHIQQIIRDYGLERFDTVHPPPRPDLNPTEPYRPTDPRDNYHALPGTNSDRPRPGLPYWLVGILLLLVAFLSGQAAGGGWMGVVIEVAKRAIQ